MMKKIVLDAADTLLSVDKTHLLRLQW